MYIFFSFPVEHYRDRADPELCLFMNVLIALTVPFLKERERQSEREKNTQHLITSQFQHPHLFLLFPHDFSSFPHHTCALWQRKRGMVNRWEGRRQLLLLFLKRDLLTSLSFSFGFLLSLRFALCTLALSPIYQMRKVVG